MILEIETFSVQIRRVSAASVTVLNNAYVFGVPLASFDFHRINKKIKTKNIKNRPLRPLPRRPPPLPPTTVSLAKHDPTKRITSQFKMMDRLLALEKPISEYSRQHRQNARKLTSHEWTVINEVCSLLTTSPRPRYGCKGPGTPTSARRCSS